jgi:hypothetical protein
MKQQDIAALLNIKLQYEKNSMSGTWKILRQKFKHFLK